MIFLQAAARRDSPAGACLALAEQGLVALYVSPAILAEVEDVLRRPRIRAKFHRLTDDVVSEFFDRIESIAIRVDDVISAIALPRDPKDQPYLDLALRTQAEYLVSRDRDLLEGATRIAADAIPGLRIVDPVTFLVAVRQRLVSAGGES